MPKNGDSCGGRETSHNLNAYIFVQSVSPKFMRQNRILISAKIFILCRTNQSATLYTNSIYKLMGIILFASYF